jgi:predicted aspartyl protease
MAQTKCGFNDAPDGTPGSNLLMIFGPTLFADIGFDSHYWSQTNQPPISSIQKVQALVDTGAAESCIDNVLAVELNLPIVNRRSISGAHGSHPTNIYLAQVHIPSLKFTIHGEFAGVDLIAGGQIHKTLIGRTFLRHFTMVYEGTTGGVTLFNEK